MSDLVFLLFIGAIVVQLPIGIFVYLDARRLTLTNPEVYGLGILVPAGGLIVIAIYFSRRKQLPRRDDSQA